MTLRLLLLALVCTPLVSCSSFDLVSMQDQDHACYSTWNPLPHNS